MRKLTSFLNLRRFTNLTYILTATSIIIVLTYYYYFHHSIINEPIKTIRNHQKSKTPSITLSSSTTSPPLLITNTHTSSNGLLYLLDQPNSDSTSNTNYQKSKKESKKPSIDHPIFSLIRNATLLWENKLKNQSTNLRSATEEYKRRYHRSPPRGFDEWWNWSNDKNVKLLDEYDSINRSIEPFFALPASLFRQRVDDLTNSRTKWSNDTFVISIRSGHFTLSGFQAQNGPRPRELVNLLQDIVHLLPDVDLPISIHDIPNLPESEYNETYNQPGLRGWPNICPSDSRLRKELEGLADPIQPNTQSFIHHDHLSTMNMCHHPTLWQQNGFLSTYDSPDLPPHRFSEILITPPSQFSVPVGNDPEWSNKHNKLVWRGGNTGILFDSETNWRMSQRARLVKVTNDGRGNKTFRMVDGTLPRKMKYFEADTALLNQKYFDVGFAGRPVQCDNLDGTCEAVAKLYTFKPSLDPEEMNQYKYIMDVDGNGWSGRFHRLMGTKSVVLKSTIFPECYVPVRLDYQDLYDIMAFFTGDLNGEGAQDEEGRKIGEAGKTWTERFWRKEDMQAYMFRLILEYCRLLHRDTEMMDYTLTDDPPKE
ncbi:family 90 glycosyltransferase [Melampsora larici-populina 98AG31]|uniref:Family 90 glycosyltransferase n=1 Tax=Melampsora larici-populina (strain 98AG31 / pathotype 3-4-7) TaxID=747676 RepID=F4RB54_MELLP|nr:family 90 glycosyltransferase [Melampsora larici-populina 98AG31]EGG10345.1 family 90 glycosyltransferase [Melampsora larici-populina 98AG31]